MAPCQYKDERCRKQASYGEERGKPIFCGLHRPQGWENVVVSKCFCGKIATWGREGTKERIYCALHGKKIEGMEDRHRKCKCGKSVPTFAKSGEKAVCCEKCREPGMIDVVSKRCAIDGCETIPSYGLEGGPGTHCAPHGRERGMVDVANKQCAVEGCDTQPSYGLEGGPATHCAPHGREKGMVNVKDKRCAVDGCETMPSYGLEGGPATHCAPHAEEGMKNVISKRCGHPGCETIPVFGFEGGLATHCGPHALTGMKNVKDKRCLVDGCETIPVFGIEHGKPTHCGLHALIGMVDVKNKQCRYPGCETRPSFGVEGGPATHCGPHALPGMRDVVHRKCASCGLFIVPKVPYLCSYCTPNTSKRQKTREMKIKALLEATTDLNDPIHDKPVGGDCGKYRPDFRYNALTHSVVIEVDEDQHRSYDPECERIRMINIVQAVGMRCVFVRYNPDTFKIDGKTVRVYEKKRHDLLLRTIRECMKPSFDSEISRVVYLYYDGAEIRHQEDLFGSSVGLAESRRSPSPRIQVAEHSASVSKTGV